MQENTHNPDEALGTLSDSVPLAQRQYSMEREHIQTDTLVTRIPDVIEKGGAL